MNQTNAELQEAASMKLESLNDFVKLQNLPAMAQSVCIIAHNGFSSKIASPSPKTFYMFDEKQNYGRNIWQQVLLQFLMNIYSQL
jgi:hypothetical protein